MIFQISVIFDLFRGEAEVFRLAFAFHSPAFTYCAHGHNECGSGG